LAQQVHFCFINKRFNQIIYEGTVDVGAVDDLTELAAVATAENLWFHVDAAFAGLGVLSPLVRPLLQGMQLAHSVAFDFHKWGQVQYDAGFMLCRDGNALRDTFSSPAVYLSREKEGLAGGDFWPCDYG
jgi:glutamate/tyrosine decarboxylase-like PLP-dependent enzyme